MWLSRFRQPAEPTSALERYLAHCRTLIALYPLDPNLPHWRQRCVELETELHRRHTLESVRHAVNGPTR